MRSQEEKDKMLLDLEESKKTIPEFSKFGQNNWEDINFTMDVIRDDWDEDDIYDNIDNHESQSLALIALQWLDGDDEVVDELLNK